MEFCRGDPCPAAPAGENPCQPTPGKAKTNLHGMQLLADAVEVGLGLGVARLGGALILDGALPGVRQVPAHATQSGPASVRALPKKRRRVFLRANVRELLLRVGEEADIVAFAVRTLLTRTRVTVGRDAATRRLRLRQSTGAGALCKAAHRAAPHGDLAAVQRVHRADVRAVAFGPQRPPVTRAVDEDSLLNVGEIDEGAAGPPILVLRAKKLKGHNQVRAATRARDGGTYVEEAHCDAQVGGGLVVGRVDVVVGTRKHVHTWRRPGTAQRTDSESDGVRCSRLGRTSHRVLCQLVAADQRIPYPRTVELMMSRRVARSWSW